MAQMWEIVGGLDTGGIKVRHGVSLTSQLFQEKLAFGALVEQITMHNDRLHYKRITGTGPVAGWVSVRIRGTEMAVKTDERLTVQADTDPGFIRCSDTISAYELAGDDLTVDAPCADLGMLEMTLLEQNGKSLDLTGCNFGNEENASPICSICNGSGCYGFSKCTFCDGIPKPVTRSCLSKRISVEKQTEIVFALNHCSDDIAEHHTSGTIDTVAQDCMVCATDCADVVLKNCGHGGVCTGCTQKMCSEKAMAFCPWCRVPIEAFFEVNPNSHRSLVRVEFQVNVHRWTR